MTALTTKQIYDLNHFREAPAQAELGTRLDALEQASGATPLIPTVAGTVEASKLVLLGTNKNIDTIAIPVSGLKIGAGAGTAVTASAAELNVNTGVTAGAVTASKTVVAGSAKNLDTLSIALPGFGVAGVEVALTAHSGGTQAAALALSSTKAAHVVATVAAGGDSVKLPVSDGTGKIHLVNNSGANSMQLFGTGTDTINGVAAATGIAVAAGKSVLVCDIWTGAWVSVTGA